MATENPRDVQSFVAAEDLSDYQYCFVGLGAEGYVQLLNGGTEPAYGVLQNAPAEGEVASVMRSGRSKVVASTALACSASGTVYIIPEYVGAADNGKAAVGAYNSQTLAGILIEDADAEDDLATIQLLNCR